jgi:hypothetical protein
LLLKGEDVLLVDKVYEFEMFVEHVAVVLDALLEVGDARSKVRKKDCSARRVTSSDTRQNRSRRSGVGDSLGSIFLASVPQMRGAGACGE